MGSSIVVVSPTMPSLDLKRVDEQSRFLSWALGAHFSVGRIILQGDASS